MRNPKLVHILIFFLKIIDEPSVWQVEEQYYEIFKKFLEQWLFKIRLGDLGNKFLDYKLNLKCCSCGWALIFILSQSLQDRAMKNDCYCWICHHTGNMLCCEKCPRVFHLKCIPLTEEPDEDWICPCCSVSRGVGALGLGQGVRHGHS